MINFLKRIKLRTIDGKRLDHSELVPGERVQLFVDERKAGKLAVVHTAKGDAELAATMKAERVAKGKELAAVIESAKAAKIKE